MKRQPSSSTNRKAGAEVAPASKLELLKQSIRESRQESKEDTPRKRRPPLAKNESVVVRPAESEEQIRQNVEHVVRIRGLEVTISKLRREVSRWKENYEKSQNTWSEGRR